MRPCQEALALALSLLAFKGLDFFPSLKTPQGEYQAVAHDGVAVGDCVGTRE